MLSSFEIAPVESSIEWQMGPAERLVLRALLAAITPRVAIEIGSKFGGSLRVLTQYCQKVVSFDIDPGVSARLGPEFPDVDFIVGDSRETLPSFLKQSSYDFALVDGDHSARGAQLDCENLTRIRPEAPTYILVHDSFNPEVRRGILAVDWEQNPFVQVFDIDFVPGVMFAEEPLEREMWGGFALAVLAPEPRKGAWDLGRNGKARIDLVQRPNHAFQLCLSHSAHHPWGRLIQRMKRSARRMFC